MCRTARDRSAYAGLALAVSLVLFGDARAGAPRASAAAGFPVRARS